MYFDNDPYTMSVSY